MVAERWLGGDWWNAWKCEVQFNTAKFKLCLLVTILTGKAVVIYQVPIIKDFSVSGEWYMKLFAYKTNLKISKVFCSFVLLSRILENLKSETYISYTKKERDNRHWTFDDKNTVIGARYITKDTERIYDILVHHQAITHHKIRSRERIRRKVHNRSSKWDKQSWHKLLLIENPDNADGDFFWFAIMKRYVVVIENI